MQPNQPPVPHDPQRYDFFLNPPTPPKKSIVPNLPVTRDPFIKKIIMVIGGGLLLILVVSILASVVFGGKSNTADLLKLTQQQNELIRVAGEATPGAVQQTTKSLAINTQLSLMTSQQQMLSYLQKQNHKVGTKQLALTKSTATDQQLKDAQVTSNFDSVFIKIVQQQLQAYTAALKQNYTSTSNAKLRQLLNTQYAAGTLLLAQANSTTVT